MTHQKGQQQMTIPNVDEEAKQVKFTHTAEMDAK
jgi:hypothetical protein